MEISFGSDSKNMNIRLGRITFTIFFKEGMNSIESNPMIWDLGNINKCQSYSKRLSSALFLKVLKNYFTELRSRVQVYHMS